MSVSTLFNYNLNGLASDFAEIMRLQDWDIDVRIVSGGDMVSSGCSLNTRGTCTKERFHNEAIIELNHEHQDMETEYNWERKVGWVFTFIHELVHITLDPYCINVETATDFIKDEGTHKIMDECLQLGLELVTNQITKTILNFIGPENLASMLEKHKKVCTGTDFEKELQELMAKYEIKGGVNIATAKTAE